MIDDIQPCDTGCRLWPCAAALAPRPDLWELVGRHAFAAGRALVFEARAADGVHFFMVSVPSRKARKKGDVPYPMFRAERERRALAMVEAGELGFGGKAVLVEVTDGIAPLLAARLAATKKKPKRTKAKVHLDEVYNGRRLARTERLPGPDGAMVSVTRVEEPIRRLHRQRMIDDDQLSAGLIFHEDYEVAEAAVACQVSDPMKINVRGGNYSDPILCAGITTTTIARALSRLPDMLHRSIAESVIGQSIPIAEWVRAANEAGVKMNEHRASGLVVGALDVLADFYGTRKQRATIAPARSIPATRAERRPASGYTITTATMTIERAPESRRPVLMVKADALGENRLAAVREKIAQYHGDES